MLAAPVAWAQADLPDAGLPDASIGEEGAERGSEEQDTSSNATTICLSSSDCDRGFQCIASHCVYRRFRDATEEGCVCSAPGAGWAWLAAAWWLRRRRVRD